MSIASFARLLTASVLVAGAFSASSAVMVLGSGPEKDCYDFAKADRASAVALESCNDALTSGALTSRDTAATYTNRSVLLLDMNQADKALDDANKALSIAPSMTAAAVNRSAALIRLNRYQEARAAVDSALPFASGEELKRGLFNRAMANEAMGDVKGAYRDLKRAVEVDPNFEAAQVELARYTVRQH